MSEISKQTDDGFAARPVRYPETARNPVVEEHFGTQVVDPYRWLEEDAASDSRVHEWIERQRTFTEAHLSALPHRKTVRQHLETVWGFEKLGCPVERNGRYFYEWNSGLLNHNAIVVQDGLRSAARVVLDPNAIDASGSTVVRDWSVSRDGRLLAYTVQPHGGDWRTLLFLDVERGVLLQDELVGLKTRQFALLADGSGVVYTAFGQPESGRAADPTLRSAVYIHRFGQPQSRDERVHESEPEVALLNTPFVSDDGRWLIILTSNAGMTKAEVRIKDLHVPDAPLRTLVAGLQNRWSFVGSADDSLYFVTDCGAPHGCVRSLDPTKGSSQVPATVILEADHPIRGCVLAGDELVVQYQAGIATSIRRFSRSGEVIGTISLPAASVVDQISATTDAMEFFYRVSSMVEAPTIWRCDLTTDASEVFRAPTTSWKSRDFVVRQIVATSRDGTPIPVTLAHRQSLDRSRPHATIMLAYGGFGISPDICFWESRFAWISLGGVFAVAHTRGGAEFGSDWALAARKAGRLKVIEDYLAAADALRVDGIAAPGTLVACGASNGGLLVAAATNARPDAFAATIARVPPTDMIRYTRFTLGRIWVDELGDPESEADFKVLMAYSPLHNVRAGRAYPAILVTTAESDDRVVPAHAFKYVATLQGSDIGPKPHLIRYETKSGHGEGKATSQLIDEFTDLWSFAAAHAELQS